MPSRLAYVLRMHETTPSIEFDRGTIIVDGISQESAEKLADIMTWDPRESVWRAPAHHYIALAKRLRDSFGSVRDMVRNSETPAGHWTSPELRTYQEAALLAWRSAGGRGLVCLPTGAGKTRVALAAMQRSRRATLCLVPTRVLLHQWVKAIKEFYDGPIGRFGDGERDIQGITVATFESAFRGGWWLGNRFDLLIVDEAHHFGDAMRDEALESSVAPFRLGLSATVDEAKAGALSSLIGPIVFEQKLADLAGTVLADFDLACLHLPLTPAERQAYESDYGVFQKYRTAFVSACPNSPWETFVRIAMQSPEGRTAMAAHHRARRMLCFTTKKRELLVQLLDRHAGQKKLIFTADAATALHISRTLLIAPITADVGKVERDAVLAAFRSGKLRTIVSCKVLNEGLDVSDAEVAIVVGGSSAAREHIQRIGRVLRPAPDKRAVVYELLAADTIEVQQSRRRGRAFEGKRKESYGDRAGGANTSVH